MGELMRVCRKCRLAKPHTDYYAKRAKCKDCVVKRVVAYQKANHAVCSARVRAWKRAHPEANRRYPEKDKARFKLAYAVRTGEIVKPKHCEVCEKRRKLHGHHYAGYRLWAMVHWLCQQCHAKEHARLRRLERQCNLMTK